MRWRVNEPTQEDIDQVNKRFIDPKATNPILPNRGTPITVCDNVSRLNALRFLEHEMVKKIPHLENEATSWRMNGVLLIQANVTQAEGHQPVHPKHEIFVRNLSSRRLKGAGNLLCVTGADYMVTINQKPLHYSKMLS